MFVSRSAQTREKHPRTPNLHAVSCFDGGTTKSEARRTIKQDETNQSILAELVAHLRAENADQRPSFAARLEAKDAQVSYSAMRSLLRLELKVFSRWRVDRATGS